MSSLSRDLVHQTIINTFPPNIVLTVVGSVLSPTRCVQYKLRVLPLTELALRSQAVIVRSAVFSLSLFTCLLHVIIAEDGEDWWDAHVFRHRRLFQESFSMKVYCTERDGLEKSQSGASTCISLVALKKYSCESPCLAVRTSFFSNP